MAFNRETIIQTFVAESEEGLAAIEAAVVELEQNPGEKEILRSIFRSVHTLKGNCFALGFSGLGEVAHALEDLLDGLMASDVVMDGHVATLVLESVDVLRQLVSLSASGNEDARLEDRTLLTRLKRARSTATQATAPDESSTVAERAQSPMARTLRVALDKLDRMLTLTGEVAVCRARVREALELLGDAVPREVRELELDTDRLFLEVQELVMKARMVSVATTFGQYTRAVRDVATSHGKMARLMVDAEDVELDTTVSEHIRGALTHMIRNAVDHGIEAPDVRRALGKDPIGTILLRARQHGSTILIDVIDDGAGLDRDRILEKARALRLVPEPESLPDDELHELIFTPGFSTVETVTELSGRGIGMDVVRRNINALRGSVSIRSARRVGTEFSIRLPLTLAIIDGLVVGVGEDRFVIPLSSVEECVELASSARDSRRGILELRGRPVPFVRLRELFGTGGTPPARENVVVVQGPDGRAGIAVDELLGDAQTVIKPLGRLFEQIPGISGSAILGSGRVALILDAPMLLRGVPQRREGMSPSVGASASP